MSGSWPSCNATQLWYLGFTQLAMLLMVSAFPATVHLQVLGLLGAEYFLQVGQTVDVATYVFACCPALTHHNWSDQVTCICIGCINVWLLIQCQRCPGTSIDDN